MSLRKFTMPSLLDKHETEAFEKERERLEAEDAKKLKEIKKSSKKD